MSVNQKYYLMKKYYYSILSLVLLASCQQFSDVKSIGKVEPLSVNLKLNVVVKDGVPAPEEYTVKLINYNDKFQVEKKVSADQTEFSVSDIVPGIYTVSVSGESVTQDFTYNFNGNVVNTGIVENGKNITVDIAASRSGNLVIKEIFYCGSRTPSGGSYFRDQFYEIYNNSESVVYVDGLCFGNMLPKTATASLPVWDVENADSYVYFQTIWQVPGDGDDYPVAPGESIIIAQMADNHQQEHLNPTSPVNLISAEFETLINTTSLIKDNPAINMKVAFAPSLTAQWLVTVFGGAYAMFFPSEKIDPNTYVTPVGTKQKAKNIPIDDIIDAVELVNDETKMKLKRVPAVLDAGAIYVSGSYVSESVCRKIKETKDDGRVIFMDTNNTSEDFEVMTTPQIRRYGSKIPSWNTWAK